MKKHRNTITLIVLILSILLLSSCQLSITTKSLVENKSEKETSAETNTKDLKKTSNKESEEIKDSSKKSLDNNQTNTKPIRIAALRGPTSMGLSKFLNDNKDNKNYEFTLMGSINEIAPAIAQNKVDILAAPSNFASVLYNKTQGDVKVLAINTLGVLYLIENKEEVKSILDLKGKTIIASGKGATPEFALDYILEKNGLILGKDVNIEWKSEHAECVAALNTNDYAIALLPQPFVSVATLKNKALITAIDLNKEWDNIQENSKQKSSMITGVLIGKKEFVDSNTKEINEFLEEYKKSTQFVNENIDEAAVMINDIGILKTAIAKVAIPKSNITFIAGKEMQDKLSGYLKVLFNKNPKSIGGKLPDENFYYKTN